MNLLLCTALALSAPVREPPSQPPVPATAAPMVEEARLSGGGRVWLLHRPEIPLVRIDLSLEWGSALTTVEDRIASSLAHNLLGTGTTELSATEFASELASLGASWQLGMSHNRLWGYVEVPTGDERRALELLTSALTDPEFSPKTARRVTRDLAAYQKTLPVDLDRIHERGLNHAWYPVGHPQRDFSTEHTVHKSSAKQAMELVGRVVREGQLNVVVVGDFEPGTITTELDDCLGHLSGRTTVSRPPPVSPPGRLILVDLPGAPLARLSLLAPGPSFDDPQLPAGEALLEVLAGSATSRIPIEIREQRALVYDLDSELDSWSGSGRFGIHTTVGHPQVVDTLLAMESHLDSAVQTGFETSELVWSRNQLVMQNAKAMATNRNAAQTLSVLMHRHQGPDLLAAQSHVLAMLSTSQVSAATARWLAKNNRVWVITGEAAVLEPQLEAANRVPDRIIVARALAASP